MQSLLAAMQDAVAQGVLWSIMTLGVYITFRVLDFADLTVDGSFATGGIISAMLVSHSVSPMLALLAALLGGMLCGFVTGFLHTKLEIPGILASILTMIALYSINLRISNFASNVPLLGVSTIFDQFGSVLKGVGSNVISLIIGLLFVVVIISVLYWFFGTEMGSSIRATGDNEYMVRALGVNTNTMKIIGLVLSNGLVGLSGALVAQNQHFGDVGMGTGTIVIGLASVIIGEVLMGHRFSFAYKLASVVVGSIIYRVMIAVVLQLGLKSSDLKLLTALLVAIALSIPVMKRKLFTKVKPAESEEEPND
ncbi:MAG TPA: ABC transporter permease [Clostridiales bacterium]|nr:ABC transporter permease [Clostridiales bacterium]